MRSVRIWIGLFVFFTSTAAAAAGECNLDADCTIVYGNCDCEVVAHDQIASAKARFAQDKRVCKSNYCDGRDGKIEAACRSGKCVKRSVVAAGSKDPPADIDACAVSSDCVLVPYRHCCGSTKKAIQRKYSEAYRAHPGWGKFDDPQTCAMIGICRPDADVRSADCIEGRCVLKWPSVN